MRGALASIFVIAATALSALGEPAGSQDAREIVVRANTAAGKLSAISYMATLHGDGILAQQFPDLSGSVIGRKATGGRLQIRVDGAIKSSPNSPGAPIKYVNSGAEVYFTEETAHTVKIGRQEDTAGLAVNAMCPIKFLGDSVFHEELRSALSLAPPETIEGVECDVVVAAYDVQGTKTARFYISRKDNLVRRIVNNLSLRMAGRNDPLRGSLTFTATNLNTQPAIDDKMFVGDVPAGFKRESFPVEIAAGGAAPNGPAPDWELKAADGKTVSLKGLRGKFVVLDFWATWCGPCKMAMPGMQKLHERFKDKPVVVYGMNCWERMPDPMAYIKSKNFTYPQLLKTDQVAAAYGVSGIPAIFVINPEGKIVHQIRGYIADAEDQIAKIIEPALSK